MNFLGNFWLELTNPRFEEEAEAHKEYMTRVIFTMVSAGLVIMTLIVFITIYSFGEPIPEPIIIMLSMDALVIVGWILIGKKHWRVSGYMVPMMFIVYSAYMISTRGLITTAVLQLAIAILLAGMLSGNRARWIMLVISLVVYLSAGWASGQRDLEVLIMAGILVAMSLVGITLLEWFFANLLNNSLHIAYKREAEIRSIFRAAPIGIGMVVNRVIREANDTLCHMTGYAREELIGKSAHMLYRNQEDYDFVGTEKYDQISKKGVGMVETRWLRKDGEIRDILLSSTPLDPADLLRGVTFSALDITERKQAEVKQTALLREKEILLAEVHHRVKNNMQVINSLLSLQAKDIADEGMHMLFEENRSRIQSMVLVHEQLYRSGEYANIDFEGYINQLASTLFSMYQVDANRIRFRVEAENVKLDLVKAVPCGLLLNEVITNSLKYAFPGDAKGELWVMVQAKDQKIILDLGDNGIGLPENFDIQSATTLGLNLINLLVMHDLQGRIAYESKNGVQFHIEFPVNKPSLTVIP